MQLSFRFAMSALRLQFSAITSRTPDPSSCTGQPLEHDAISGREKQRQTAKAAAGAHCECPTPYTDGRAAAPPQRLSTIKSENENGQESDGERGNTQQLQQQHSLQHRLGEGKVPLVV